MDKDSQQALSKVPEITLIFWIIKLFATTMVGTTLATGPRTRLAWATWARR